MKYCLLLLTLLLLGGCFVPHAMYKPEPGEMMPASLVPNNYILYRDSTLQVDMVAPHIVKRQANIAYGIDVTFYGTGHMYLENVEVEIFAADDTKMEIAPSMSIYTPNGKFDNMNYGDIPDSCRYSSYPAVKTDDSVNSDKASSTGKRSFKAARVPYTDAEAVSKFVNKENRSFRLIKYHPKKSFDIRKKYILRCYANLLADDRRVILDREIHIQGYND